MFIALKEMRTAKLRYSLIIGIMILIAYVVFMLSGLASGLAIEFRKGVEDWQAKEIILSEEANKTLVASQLTRNDLDSIENEDKAPIGLFSSSIKGTDQSVIAFGTDSAAFIIPEIIEGNVFSEKNQIIISQNLADEGYKIGDTLHVGKYEDALTIVGIFPESYYTVSPIIYSDLDTWTEMKFGDQPFAENGNKPLNAIALNSSVTFTDNADAYDTLSTNELIQNIPGYSAQSLTLNAMIYFLFVVATAIIGIFMYVITLQKTTIFGVMKAQGIKNFFIARSLIAQAFIVGILGVGIAMILAILTSLILPGAMPFTIIWTQWILYSAILVLVAILGGVFSIRTVSKVDPITAIGG